MKFTLALMALMTLASCGGKHSSESKSCTYNDQPIDCSEMNSQSAPSTVTSSVTSKVSSKIIIFNNKLTIENRTSNVSRETINGKLRECETSTSGTEVFWFSVNEKKLTLNMDNETVSYDRIGGEERSIYGSWVNKEVERDHIRLTTLVISEGNIQIVAKCIFK